MPSTLLPARHVDQICDGFEAAWKASGRAGARPRIEDYLAAVAQPEQAALCPELIKLDIAADQVTKLRSVVHYNGLPIDARSVTDAVVSQEAK